VRARPVSMVWAGDVEGFVGWMRETVDLGQVGAALTSVPDERWPEVAARLEAALARDEGEPTAGQLRVGTDLTERMRTPAAILRRQVRLEKLRLVRARPRV
jgi:hypothetical protein